MKIACFEVKDGEKEFLKANLKGHTLTFFPDPLNAQTAAKAKGCQGVCVFIYSKIDAATIQRLPGLKLIATRSTGFDHIDLPAAKKAGIIVSNVPTYGENTVAEHTFALILALSRNVHKSYMRTINGDFSIEGLKGFDLMGRTLGVIGAGHIGLHVIRIARGFGMKVLAFDKYPNKFMAEVLGYEYASMEAIFKQADIITLHTPYNPATHHLISKKTLKRLKKGVIIVNTARGPLIELDALLEGLDKGIIAGAGLDVIEGEELIKEEKQLVHDPKKHEELRRLVKDHLIFMNEKVVFTPHIAFYSQEAIDRILDTTCQNIKAFAEGKQQNVVG